MRISPPSVVQRDGRQVLEAAVTLQSDIVDYPPTLWFSSDREARCFLPELSDAFLVGLIASAMYLREDIHVEGAVSTRLAHGLETYQQALSTWWPGIFNRVEIHYGSLVNRRNDPRPSGMGCTFSGGLDSFHAVHQLLPERVKYEGFSITHALMINGFDQFYDPKRLGLAQNMYNHYQPLLKAWGVDLLMLDTNLKAFRNVTLKRPEQVHSYSSSLAACAHALGGIFGRFGISGHATYAYNQLEPDGSHPATDPLLSSDQLQIIHTGTNHSRSRKTELLADAPQVRQGLRVCFGAIEFDPASGMPMNCCMCEKCVRTISALIIIDKLDAFPTFGRRRYRKYAYRNPDILQVIDDHHLKDMTEMARRHEQSDWVQALEQARALKRAAEGGS